MTIKIRHRNINISMISKLFEISFEDCASWIEEFLLENEIEYCDYETLEDVLTDDQMFDLCKKIIEHFKMEESFKVNNILPFAKNIKILLN